MKRIDIEDSSLNPTGGQPGPDIRFSRLGPCAVSVLRDTGFDETRQREVPVKIHFPSSGQGPFPAVFFSHGLGGSREGYAYLGRHWASHGITAVHVQHAGTDKNIFKGTLDFTAAMRDAAKSAENMLNRAGDMRFWFGRLTRLCSDPGSALHGRVDFGRIATAGHSMGATTALACAGRKLPGPDGARLDCSDPRVRACVSMSASSGDLELSRPDYTAFSAPCLHMTSTNDASPIGRTEVRHRRVPFDAIRRGEQFLIIFNGGDHMIFSDHRAGRKTGAPFRPFPPASHGAAGAGGSSPSDDAGDALYHRFIRMATTAFLDAYLKDVPESKEWILNGGLTTALEGTASLEIKQDSKEGSSDEF